jgi:hypothetical protein
MNKQARLAEALEGVKLLIEAKILQTKQIEIGVVLFGTEGTDNPLSVNGGYEHVTLLASVERCVACNEIRRRYFKTLFHVEATCSRVFLILQCLDL